MHCVTKLETLFTLTFSNISLEKKMTIVNGWYQMAILTDFLPQPPPPRPQLLCLAPNVCST